MIWCICGMIGAGKSEYAKRFKMPISDFDEIGSKEEQVRIAKEMLSKEKDLVYITCFPNVDEKELLQEHGAIFIWINTTFGQCKKNILSRNRKRDFVNLQEVFEKNKKILHMYMHSDISFEIVDVFETNERW